MYRPIGSGHLRNQGRERDEIDTELGEKFGLKFVHGEERFYKLFKTSRADFVAKLKELGDSKQQEQFILESFYGSAAAGRNGLASLKQSLELVKLKIKEKERMNKFAERFGQQACFSKKEFRRQGGMKKLHKFI